MKNKKKITIPIMLILVFLILYTIFSVVPTRSEVQFIPRWAFHLSSANVSGVVDENLKLIPFMMEKSLGYFDTAGNLVYKYDIPQRFTISDNYFILYGNDSTSFSVQNQAGQVVLKQAEAGFPYLYEDRLFVFAPGGNTVCEYDLTGKMKFQYQGYAPILSFSSAKSGCAIGFADGELCTIFPDNDIRISTYPGGSDYQIVYGCDISDSGELVACVCGYDSQRFVLYKRNGNQQKPVFHEYIRDQVTGPCEVCFTSDSKFVYYNSERTMSIVDCTKMKSTHFDLGSKILKISEIPDLNVIFVLSKDGKTFKISMIEKSANILGEYTFEAEEAFVNSCGNLLFVGADDEISCLEIVRN